MKYKKKIKAKVPHFWTPQHDKFRFTQENENCSSKHLLITYFFELVDRIFLMTGLKRIRGHRKYECLYWNH